METQTIITAFLAFALAYRLLDLLIKIIIGFLVLMALFVVGWGVCEKVGRKKE